MISSHWTTLCQILLIALACSPAGAAAGDDEPTNIAARSDSDSAREFPYDHFGFRKPDRASAAAGHRSAYGGRDDMSFGYTGYRSRREPASPASRPDSSSRERPDVNSVDRFHPRLSVGYLEGLGAVFGADLISFTFQVFDIGLRVESITDGRKHGSLFWLQLGARPVVGDVTPDLSLGVLLEGRIGLGAAFDIGVFFLWDNFWELSISFTAGQIVPFQIFGSSPPIPFGGVTLSVGVFIG